MNKVNVGLGGISRNTDDGVSKDGMCSELINARPKNGSIEPVGRPILERQFAEGKYNWQNEKYKFSKRKV